METKIRCTRCGKEKPASDYARKNGNGKILVKSCKACIEQKSARRYALAAQAVGLPNHETPPMPEILKPAYWRKYP